MFKLTVEVLKGVIGSLAKATRKSVKGDTNIYIKTLPDNLVSFYFNGQDISVERRLPVTVEADLEVATSVAELDQKVSALPNEQETTVQTEGDHLKLKWGRNSEIAVQLLPESSPMIDLPTLVETVKWKPGSLHGIARNLPPFTIPYTGSMNGMPPALFGPNFSKDAKTGEVYVRATDRFKATTVRAKKLQWFDNASISIDSKTLQGVADVLSSDAEITVGINEDSSLVVFQAGYTTCVCRVLVGTFPSIDQYYKSSSKFKMIIDRQELIDVCKRVRILSPNGAIVQFRMIGGKPFAKIPGVLEQQLSASIDGVPFSFAASAHHLEVCAGLFSMAPKADELIMYMDSYDKPITLGLDGNDDIRMICLPHISSDIRAANKAPVASATNLALATAGV